MMERMGYRVSSFTKASEALAEFRANPGEYALVVTDFNMPGISGLDVALEVLTIRPGTPVLLVCGSVSEELRTRASAVGISQLVGKPFTMDELGGAIDRVISNVEQVANDILGWN
jgi:DNA-binding response OmpR family regulator